MNLRSLIFGLLGFIAAFSFEIRVKAQVAELPNAQDVQERPEKCLDHSKQICALKTENGEKFVLELNKSITVNMDQDSAIILLGEDAIRLVTGMVWVQAGAPVTVRTEFGDAHMDKGEFWVARKDHRVVVSATGPDASSAVELMPRGSREVLVVQSGMENWLGAVGLDGKAETGLPTAIEFHNHLERWARLYPNQRKSFEKDVEKFRLLWRQASVQTAQIHQTVFERKVASVESEQERRQKERTRIENHNRALRDMFRKRVLDGE